MPSFFVVRFMAFLPLSRYSDPILRSVSGTSMKLNEKNYVLWTKSFQVILGTHRKIKHITQDPPDIKDSKYDAWFADDCVVISWLVNSMEERVARG